MEKKTHFTGKSKLELDHAAEKKIAPRK